MNTFRWRPRWYRLSVRTDRDYDFQAMGGLSAVPNQVIADGTMDEWVEALLADADEDFDDLRGEVRIEVFESPDGSTPSGVYVGRLNGTRRSSPP